MTEPTIVDRFFSLDLVAIVLGFVGALLGVSYSEPMTKKQLLAALGSGSIVAALAPPLVTLLIHLQWPTVNLPVAINNVMAFVFGIGGMFIIPGVLSFWKTFSANPWGFIDRIRGITPPPPPPGAQP